MVHKSLLWALALIAAPAAAQAAADDIVPKEVAEAALAKAECDTPNEAAPEQDYTMDGELEALDQRRRAQARAAGLLARRL